MNRAELAQIGTITDPNSFAEYLTFVLKPDADIDAVKDALVQVSVIEKSIGQKDSKADLTISMGFSSNGWDRIFPDYPKPNKLKPFVALENGIRKFPATPGDIFFMIKSERMDLNFQAAKYVRRAFLDTATLIDDVQGYKYLDSRDMIDFVDGTENPKATARLDTVLVENDIELHQGGTYLLVQKYIDIDNLLPWDRESAEYQSKVIGRSKMDDIELSDEEKPVWAHNAKSKVIMNDVEQKMFRQNRPFGNATEHGTMFVGFAGNPDVLTTSIKQMITADKDGFYDRLLDFVQAKTGGMYFFPSMTFLSQFAD